MQLVSALHPVTGPADGGSGDSLSPVITPNGRYVLFASTANNLVEIRTNTPIPSVGSSPFNVYLRDRVTGTTILVSISSDGTAGGNESSWPVAISTNGQFALFESNASNLIPGDTNSATDVFIRDVINGSTTLVSVSTNGSVGNRTSRGSVMTPDARYVAFLSGANNLAPGDTNGIPDVFVRDRQTGTTTLVSVGATSAGSSATPRILLPNALSPEITPDGRYVVFSSTATNIVPGVTSTNQIYIRDMLAGTTVWASDGADAAIQTIFGTGSAASFNYCISADGHTVVYEACPSSGSSGALLVYHPLTDSTDILHANANIISFGDNRSVDLTADGRFVVFLANTNSTDTCVLVGDTQSGTTALASGNTNSQPSSPAQCACPLVSTNGRFVAFLSTATDLVTNSLIGDYHLYVRDMLAGTTVLVDADPSGAGTQLVTIPTPSLSDDGRFVAFESLDGNLVAKGTTRKLDVFVRDTIAGTTELVSVRSPALPSWVPAGASALSISSVSSDGRYVAFFSEADNLLPNDTNGYRDVFVRDLLLGTNLLVSVDMSGLSPGDNLSTDAAISGDGRYVAFTSSADNLVTGDLNGAQDVFVRDMQANLTTLVSINSSATGSGNSDSFSPSISADGRYVLFRSKATDLATGTFQAFSANLFLRDTQSGTTVALTTNGVTAATMTPDGHFVAWISSGLNLNPYVWNTQTSARIYTNTTSNVSVIALSPNGRKLLYWNASTLSIADVIVKTNGLIATLHPTTRAGMRFSADSSAFVYAGALTLPLATTNQVYWCNVAAGTNLLISKNYSSGSPGNRSSDSPDISADGRFVAYASIATNVVPGDANGLADIFLYDLQTGVTTLLTASRFGSYSADNRSRFPVFSGDGQTLLFESIASDLVNQSFSFNYDLFSYSPYSTSPIVSFQLAIVRDAQGGSWLKWTALPERNYQVQFKNNLTDLLWQNANGSLTVVGSTAYFKDLNPSAGKRFYRVTAF